LIRLFPDGFSPLFCPAAALPALPVVPVPAVPPVAFPVVVPPVGDPVVVPLVAALPVAELPPVDCASAQVPVNASAVANPNVASFMIAPLLLAQELTMSASAAFLPVDHSSLLFPRRYPLAAAIVVRRSDAGEHAIGLRYKFLMVRSAARASRTMRPLTGPSSFETPLRGSSG
jgi:hypothetical protein